MYYLCSENKSADQLCGFDLRLCFRIYAKVGFLVAWLTPDNLTLRAFGSGKLQIKMPSNTPRLKYGLVNMVIGILSKKLQFSTNYINTTSLDTRNPVV